MRDTRSSLILRLAITGAFLALGVVYAAATPIFEKNDEDHHFALARHLAQGGGLPIQQPGVKTPWEQEGSQPPLYYALVAPIIAGFDTSDYERQVEPNASPQYSAFAPNNKNKLILTPEKRAFGYHGSALAAFAVRLVSLLAGAAAVWLTFRLALALTRNAPVALLAMGLVAFNPMFITLSSAVSNDVLVIAFATWGLCLLVECLTQGATPRRAILLGLAIGLASLSKVSGALLLPVALAALTLDAIWPGLSPALRKGQSRDGAWRTPGAWWRALKPALLVALTWVIVAGWWYARNIALYGELTGTSTMARVAGMRDPSTIEWLGELRGFRWTYLGIFGQTNIPADIAVYLAFDAFIALAALGFALHLFARRRNLTRAEWIAFGALAAHAALVAAGIAYWTQFTAASHGRLLFPAIASLATFAALGLAEWLRRLRAPARIAPALLAPFAALCLVVPFRYVLPAYQPPLVAPGTREWDLSAAPAQRFGDLAEIVAVRAAADVARPGQPVRVQALMRALRGTDRQYRLVATLTGRDAQSLARFETYTGGGLLPSRDWSAGDTWVETIDLAVPIDAASPAMLAAQFSLFAPYFGEVVTSTDAAGQPAAPLYPVAALPPPAAAPGEPALARFGEVGEIVAVTRTELIAGQPLDLALTWRATGRGERDYAAFVHLIGPDGSLVAQADGPPDGGNYPTSRWVAGTAFSEVRRMQLPAHLPAGEYRVLAGLYDPASGARVPAYDARGARARDDAVELARIGANAAVSGFGSARRRRILVPVHFIRSDLKSCLRLSILSSGKVCATRARTR